MRDRRARRTASDRLAVCLLAVCLLAGCTSEDPGPAPRPPPDRAAPAPPPVSRAPVSEASYGTDPGRAPALAVLDTVDLSPAAEGTSAFATAAVPGPDGAAFVLVTSPGAEEPHRLATVAARADGGRGVVGSVPVPDMRLIWGVHALPDGTVAVAGWLQPAERGFGFTVVDPDLGGDPGTGRTPRAVRTIVAIPHEEGTASAYGHSALSPDGSTLHLFVGTTVGFRATDLLVAVDVATGEFRAGRDLFADTRGRSTRSIGRYAAGLVPRPDGGVVLAFAGAPPGEREVPVPMLLTYDADLTPVAFQEPGGQGATGETLAVATGGGGTVFVAVSARSEEWLLTGEPGTGATTRALELVPRGFDYAFVVDPSESWLLLPAVDGVRAVDLASGAARTLGLDCGMGSPARYLTAAPDGVSALAVGQCARGSDLVPTLWTIGP
jgi:hypothetical protein